MWDTVSFWQRRKAIFYQTNLVLHLESLRYIFIVESHQNLILHCDTIPMTDEQVNSTLKSFISSPSTFVKKNEIKACVNLKR